MSENMNTEAPQYKKTGFELWQILPKVPRWNTLFWVQVNTLKS